MSSNRAFARCEVWQEGSELADDSSSTKPEFLIDMYAQFSMYPLSFKEQCHVLTESKTSWSVISNMLSQASVPYQVQPSMILAISTRAREIARDPENKNRKTIRMVVQLTVEQEQLSEDHDQTFVPRTKGTPIEELERVKIEVCGKQCVICLEEMQRGCESIRMPCSHDYHESCITNWLETSHLCPLCRFELPAASF
ncbi:hypothetical protein ACFX13_039824 [Malus domestica]|uniref:uncharacterized protein n=1 Tax=Malus domestica TaxID=3750 RepID=UPI0039768056